MSVAPRADVTVIGGGITGLAAAHRLSESDGDRSLTFVLVEAGPRLGGQVRTARERGFVLEGGPDTLVATKPAGVELCRRLGLADRLVPISAGHGRVQILHRDRLVQLPAGFMMVAPDRWGPILRSPLFSPWGKLRMALEPWVPVRREDAGDESLADFVRRRMGREVLDRVAEPLLGSLFTADAERLSVGATLPMLQQMERKHGSLVRAVRARRPQQRSGKHAVVYANVVYLRDGFDSLTAELRRRVEPRCRIETRSEVVGLAREGDGWMLELADGRRMASRAVLLCCPAYAMSSWFEGLDDDLARELAALDYASCATVNLAYDAGEIDLPSSSYGFFVPRDERCELLACSFVSVKLEGRAPSDKRLVRVFLGGARRPGVLEDDDEALADRAHAELARVLTIRARPCLSRVHRYPRSMPQYDVGHPARQARTLERLARHPGLFAAGSVDGAVGVPDCVASGQGAAQRALELVGRRAQEPA